MPSSSEVMLLEFGEEKRRARLPLDCGSDAYEVTVEPDESRWKVSLQPADREHQTRHLSVEQTEGTFALEGQQSINLFMRCVGGVLFFIQVLSVTESIVICVFKLKSGAYEGWVSRAGVH